jgi:acetyltransferase
MTIRNLNFLLQPRSVALIGASNRSSSLGGVVLRNLRTAGFRGALSLVNPRHRAIDGLSCHADVDDLPDAPELAVIASPAPTVPEIIAKLARRGAKAAIVISAGFGDEAGRRLKQQMLDAAKPQLLRLAGPNCLGLLVPGIGLNASFAQLTPRPGRIALLAQSGAILTSVLDWAHARNIGFSHLVSMGEMADVDFGDMLDYLAGEPTAGAILLYMEAVTNARKFMSAARRAARLKPVIVIKAGRHAAAAQAVISHTGALAGSDAVYEAAFQRAGMLRVHDMDELFEAVETLATARVPKGDELTILTNGGGIGILAADAVLDFGCRLATLSSETLARLDAVLPPTWSGGNPVDIIGDAPSRRYADAISVLLADEKLNALLVLDCPTAVTSSLDAAQAVTAALGKSDRTVLASWIGDTTATEARRVLADAGIPNYDTPEHAVRAFAHMVRRQRGLEMMMETPPSLPVEFTTNPAAARQVIGTALAQGRNLLTGPESRAVLRAYGIPVVESQSVETPAEAKAAADRLGAPVALKILSPDISHKSDIGGVILGLAGGTAVAEAALAMFERARRLRPDARLAGFTVEPMVDRPLAEELIVGVSEDAQFGPVILFGQGGVAVEVVADRAIALPPLNLKLARELMARTRIFKLLQGYRDRPPADLDAIAITLVKISQMIVDLVEIKELDINPLLADSTGVVALDARIGVRSTAVSGASRLSIRPYPRELEQPVTSRDGTRYLLRPILPEDEPQLIAAFGALSPEAVRLRFFAPMRELSHELAARLSQIDYDREMALVLTSPGPAGRMPIFAVVRLAADPDNDRAEYAIVVRDDLARRGLGTVLMERLLRYAWDRGLAEVYGDVLAGNQPMLNICRKLGFALSPSPETPGVVRVSIRPLRPG